MIADDRENIFQEWEHDANSSSIRGSSSKPLQKTTEEGDQIWPIGVALGMKFESAEKACRYFNSKLRAEGLPHALIGQQTYQGPYFRIGCTMCDAYLLFRPSGSSYELNGFNDRHTHRIGSRKQRHLEELEEEVFKYIRESTESQIKKSTVQLFSLSESEYERLRQKFYKIEVEDYSYLESFLKNNRYNATVHWPELRANYPNCLVAVT